MLDKLAGLGVVVWKDGRYFPGKPASILQDKSVDPVEYLLPRIVGH
jgi:hypothetical protein